MLFRSVDQWMTQQGMQMGPLLVMSALMGFGGSFISLAMSKWIAKRSMGLTVIENPRSEEERWLVETVRRLAQKAFQHVASYDSQVAEWLWASHGRDAAPALLAQAREEGPHGLAPPAPPDPEHLLALGVQDDRGGQFAAIESPSDLILHVKQDGVVDATGLGGSGDFVLNSFQRLRCAFVRFI